MKSLAFIVGCFFGFIVITKCNTFEPSSDKFIAQWVEKVGDRHGMEEFLKKLGVPQDKVNEYINDSPWTQDILLLHDRNFEIEGTELDKYKIVIKKKKGDKKPYKFNNMDYVYDTDFDDDKLNVYVYEKDQDKYLFKTERTVEKDDILVYSFYHKDGTTASSKYRNKNINL